MSIIEIKTRSNKIEITCMVCQEEQIDNRSPMIMNCGHTICNICVINLRHKKCPKCNEKIKNINRNYELSDMLTKIKDNKEKKLEIEY